MMTSTGPAPGATSRRRLAIAVAVVALLAVAAWFVLKPAGGDDRPVLRVGDQRGGIESLLAASGNADFSGYRVEWSRFPSGTPLIEAINAGAVDVGMVGDGSLIVARAAGVPVKAVSTLRDVVAGARLLVRPDSPLRTAADLKGHSIAVQRGTALHLMVLNILTASGLTDRDVSLKFLTPDESRTAFTTGAVDVWATTDPFLALDEQSPKPSRTLVDGAPYLLNAVYLVASEQAIRDRKGAIADFIARVGRSYAWSNVHPDRYAETFAKETGLPLPIAKRVVTRRTPRLADADAALIASIAQAAETYRRIGLIERAPPAQEMFDRSFQVADLPAAPRGDAEARR